MDTRYPLPAWAEPHPHRGNCILVDPDKAYPAILKELGIAENERTQYWMEVAYQFIKLDLQVAMGGFGFEVHIRADDGRKDRWRIAGFQDPEGNGVFKATKGKQARAHYRRLRGFMPG